MRKVIYKHNYDYWLEKYPALREKIPFRRMFLKLAFDQNEVGQILLPQAAIADIEGAEATKDYAAYRFLDAYQEAFPSFSLSLHF